MRNICSIWKCAKLSSLIGFFICFQSVLAQKLPDFSNVIDSLFFQENGSDRPGYSISIIKDDTVVYQRSIGMINVEKRIPFTENSVIAIASCTKQFIGFSILMLEEEGKLSLEDDIRKYIPELPEFGETVRIRHLLSHTSGIRDHLVLLDWENKQWSKDYTFKGTICGLNKYPGLSFLPGENFAYSNTGFVLLALVIERCSGIEIDQFLKDRIFDPLGMTNTQLMYKRDYRAIGFSRPYDYNWEKEKFETFRHKEVNALGAVGIYTTMNDYIKWDENFDHKTVGSNALFRKFLQTDTLNNGLSLHYNHGLKHRLVRGYQVIEHSGGWAYYNFQHARIPELGLSVIIASNNEFDYPIGMCDDFLNAVIPFNRVSKGQPFQLTQLDSTSNKFLSDNFTFRTLEQDSSGTIISGNRVYGSKSYPLFRFSDGIIADSTGSAFVWDNTGGFFRWFGGGYFTIPTEFYLIQPITNLASMEGTFFNSELGTIRIRFDRKSKQLKMKSSFGNNPTITDRKDSFFDLDNVDYDLLVKDENTLIIGNSLVFNLVFTRK